MGFFKLEECKNVLLQGLSASVDACESNCLVPVAANTTDAAKEKHVPAVTVDGDKLKVAVGSVPARSPGASRRGAAVAGPWPHGCAGRRPNGAEPGGLRRAVDRKSVV